MEEVAVAGAPEVLHRRGVHRGAEGTPEDGLDVAGGRTGHSHPAGVVPPGRRLECVREGAVGTEHQHQAK